MKIAVEWSSPLKLKDGKREGLIYTLSLDKLPQKPGVYVFGRRFGSSFEALYVGKANKIRSRVKSQLDHVKLMQHLRYAKLGKLFVLAGKVRPRPGQQLAKVLRLAELALIRHFPAKGHDLVNDVGTHIRRHEIGSSGKQPKRLIPRKVYLERGKGE